MCAAVLIPVVSCHQLLDACAQVIVEKMGIIRGDATKRFYVSAEKLKTINGAATRITMNDLLDVAPLRTCLLNSVGKVSLPLLHAHWCA